MHVIGTYKKLKKFLGRAHMEQKFDEALKIYLDNGGVLKVKDKKPLKIIYPSKARIREQLEENRKKEKYVEEQMKQWQAEMNKLNVDGVLNNFSRTANPAYWQHLIQIMASPEYRKSFEIVDPPIELMNKPRYRKMIEMFVKSPEYRERLVEARTSILGKMRDSIKESAYKSANFKKDTIQARLGRLREEKELHGRKANSLSIMLEMSGRFF